MNVTVVGTGYVGLVTAAGLAEHGHVVTCVDQDATRVAAISDGRAPFHEPGLDALVERGRSAGLLHATHDLARAVTRGELTIVAVGTPARDGHIDLRFIERAVSEIGTALAGRPDNHVVAIKSTVVPGTTVGAVQERLLATSGTAAGQISLAMIPEFTREGSAVRDFLEPDRIVIGHNDARSRRVLEALYASFDCPKLFTTPSNAEMIKYSANALLATLVSFGNEIAALCEATPGTDAALVIEGVALDRRCRATSPTSVPDLLTYLRASTDDVRNSPAAALITRLLGAGATVRAFDPVATRVSDDEVLDARVRHCTGAADLLAGADAALLATAWPEFATWDWARLTATMRRAVVGDGRGLLSDLTWPDGVTYFRVGKML